MNCSLSKQLSLLPIEAHNRQDPFINLYSRIFKFRSRSRLPFVLAHANSAFEDSTRFFTFTHILKELRSYILTHKLLDENNFTMIICDPLLSFSLSCAALHAWELRHRVLHEIQPVHFALTHPFPLLSEIKTDNIEVSIPSFDSLPNHVVLNYYQLVKPFCKLLQYSPLGHLLYDTERKYSFSVIWQVVTGYLHDKSRNLIDPRTPEIYFIKHDPISTFFKVSAFHNGQLGYFLQNQLLPDCRILYNNLENMHLLRNASYYLEKFPEPKRSDKDENLPIPIVEVSPEQNKKYLTMSKILPTSKKNLSSVQSSSLVSSSSFFKIPTPVSQKKPKSVISFSGSPPLTPEKLLPLPPAIKVSTYDFPRSLRDPQINQSSSLISGEEVGSNNDSDI